MKITLALLAGLLYSLGYSLLFYSFTEGVTWLPLFHGLVFGIATGDVETGLLLGASISTLYISLVPVGSSVAADCVAAGTIGIPLALMAGLPTGEAVALAMAVGMVGNVISPIQFNLNSYWAHVADKYAEQGDAKKIRNVHWGAILFTTLLRFPIAFAVVFFGADFVNVVLSAVPEFVIGGLDIASGLLPALGIAMTLYVINKPKFIPFFLIAYFMTVVFGVSTLVASVFGICIAFLIIMFKKEADDERM